MDDQDIGASMPLLPAGIPPRISDRREPYQKHMALYIICLSTLLERIAFYSLAANLVLILKSPNFGWNDRNSVIAIYIFLGK